MISYENIIGSCKIHSIPINKEQAEKLAAYSNMVLKENETTNLTRNDSDEDMINKNIIDSLRIVPYIEGGSYVADIGCGAGVPGIVVSIMTDCRMVLVDSITKKIEFVRHVGEELGLDIITINDRAERLGRDQLYREKFDYVISRALAPLNVLLEYGIPLLKKNGFLIAMKGAKAMEEIQNARNSFTLLNSECREQVRYNNIDGIDRYILLVEKLQDTSDLYPRNTKKIVKQPL